MNPVIFQLRIMQIVFIVLFAVPLLLIISVIAFTLVHLVPGGPFDRERNPGAPEIERNLRATYHLDEPVWNRSAFLRSGLGKGHEWPLASRTRQF